MARLSDLESLFPEIEFYLFGDTCASREREQRGGKLTEELLPAPNPEVASEHA
jgi:hypothetical protein